MTACIQSVAMFGSELWWKGDQIQGTIGQANELQLLVNREARATTGCFRTTSLGSLSMESGLGPAAAQLEDRQRRFGLRLLCLPQGDQAREIIGTPTAMINRTKAYERSCLRRKNRGYSFARRTRDPRSGTAKADAEKSQPGLIMFTEGPRLDDGATGYAVVWKNGQSSVGIKTHMGYTRRPTARSVPPSPGPRRQLREDKRCRNKSRSSPTHRRPSDEWPRRSLAPAKNTRSGQGSTSQCYGEPGQISASRSGGARRTRGPRE